jgi:hypothetical protein
LSFFFTMAQQTQWTKASFHYRGFMIIRRHTTLGRTTLDEWSALHRDLYLTIQHSQQTDIHAPGGIWTRSPRKRAAANLRLRPCGHWDRPLLSLGHKMDTHISFCVRSNARSDILGVMDKYLSVILFEGAHMSRDITTQTLRVLYHTAYLVRVVDFRSGEHLLC